MEPFRGDRQSHNTDRGRNPKKAENKSFVGQWREDHDWTMGVINDEIIPRMIGISAGGMPMLGLDPSQAPFLGDQWLNFADRAADGVVMMVVKGRESGRG